MTFAKTLAILKPEDKFEPKRRKTMAKITVNFDKKCGKIKPLHGVGQPPFVGTDFSYFHYLTEANIPFSRLHDVGGAYGGNLYADIPNLFRDFDANE